MFSNSNKLTRPEKALILGFIAGSRGKKKKKIFNFNLIDKLKVKFSFKIVFFSMKIEENPRPEQGPLLTIKLNESEEIFVSNGVQNKAISELFFQMNYDTGEYKKIKKFKPINI